MSDDFKPLLARLADGATLTEADAESFFAACLRGEPTPAQIAAAITAMRLRGETVGEIAACARALRRAARVLEHDFQVIDTCGTGGDGLHTYNISTAAALIAAGGGLKVAKHGNRAMSSRSGSSDVLRALGVNLDATPAQSLRALETAGICFLFAPAHHGALRHVTPMRAELGFRTVFNLLGPLANPAGAQRPWAASGLGSCTARAWTRSAPAARPRWRNGAMARCAASRSPRKLWACLAPTWRRCAAAIRPRMRTRCGPCSMAHRVRIGTSLF
jgi:anthranilate phosphoribosyltransferase